MPNRIEEPPLTAVSLGEYAMPASFAQRRLWVLYQLDPASAAYNVPLAVWLAGPLDDDRLRAAFTALAARHETLRTRFAIEDGELAQIVAEAAASVLVVAPAPNDEAALELARAAARQPFALADGPLWRVFLVRVAAERHLLLLNLHHTICDGWSIGVLLDELGRLYGSPDAALPPLPVQYADYAAWQTAQLSGVAGEALIERCRRRLAGVPQSLDLPIDRKRPATRSGHGGSVSLVIPIEVAARLRDLASAQRATPMMAHAGIFAALLARWCNQTQLLLGVPVAGRGRPETDRVIGPFVNTLLLPCDLRGEPDFTALIGRVRDAVLAVLADQALPFERIVEALQPARLLGQNPLFQVLFAYQNLPPARLQLHRLQVEPAELGPATPQFDLVASLAEESGAIVARLDYDAALFERDTIGRLAESWRLLAEAVAADPGLTIGAAPIASATEAASIVGAAGPTPTAIPTWSVHEAIIERARREPHRVCLFDDEGRLDGAGLAAAIEGVARRLAAAGIGRGHRVGVYVGRSRRLVAALLGVLAAGAAYVPLDPLYPRERIADILASADTRAVITERALAADVPHRVLIILDEPGAIAAVRARASPDDLAYVIFTSGSTGAPKGVLVGHRALTNLLAAMAQSLRLRPCDTWLATTTVSFDIAALELFLPLLKGARLVIAGAASVSDGEALAEAIDSSDATVMQATPSGWRLLLTAGWRGKKDLTALSGGEALPAELAVQLAARTRAVWNLYGPTETTIWSTAAIVRDQVADLVPVGPPIANTCVHVLDSRMRPVPRGAIGEVCIAGAGLAWGYIGRQDLTAERFVADPHGPPGTRLYRTGDLGRRRRDGLIDFLGRNDQQVKLRGYRIEIGEIEAALRNLDGVKDAAVGLRGVAEAAELVAWIADGGAGIDAAMLHSAVARRLPRYMVPTRFVPLDALPLTPNGKLDRARLPDPGHGPENNPTPLAPRDRTEAAVLQIWEEVLGRRGFGVEDDFFALGGHSLLAVRLIARLRDRCGGALGVRDLFACPTVAGLAAALAAPQDEDRPPLLLPLARGGGRLPLLLVPGAGGNPLYLRPLAAAFVGERPVWGFEAIGSDGSCDPLGSVEAIAEAYLDAARARRLGPPWLFVGHSFGSRVAYEMVRQAESAGEVVQGLIILDTAAPVLDSNPFAAIAADESRIQLEVAGALDLLFGDTPACDALATADRPPEAPPLARIMRRLHEAGWRSEAAAIRGLCNVYRSALATHYRARGGIAARLLLVKATKPLAMPGDALVPELARLLEDPLWGWNSLCRPDRITLAEAKGDHITMLSAANAPALAALMRRWLSQCDPSAAANFAAGKS